MMKLLQSTKPLACIACLLAVAVLPAWSRKADEPLLSRGEILNRALEKINEIPEFLQFYELFPDAKFVLDNESTFAEPRIEGRVLLNRRYTFNIGITFEVNEDGSLRKVRDVDFKLQEISRVRKKGNGVYAEFEKEWDLTPEDFSKLRGANGDFSELGISLVDNEPVKHVMEYWRLMTG